MTTTPSSSKAVADPVVEFRETDHTYWLVEEQGKRRLISITQVLQVAGLVDTTFFNERAATKGTYVHDATALHDQGRLNDATVSDELRPYLDGYKLFLEECTPEWSRIEAMFADDVSDVAGTVDRVGTITVKGVPQKVVVDLKTGRGGSAPWHPIQLAGYQHLLTQYLSRRGQTREAAQIKRYGLYLRGDGRYTLTPYTNTFDAAVFTSALTIAHWITQVGPKQGRHGWQH
jgi:hypothetical protein